MKASHIRQSDLRQSLVWDELRKILDPEIPVLNVVEMKIVRDVHVYGKEITVLFSPTFVGCPAIDMMHRDIRTRLQAMGFDQVNIETTFSPPWSTDMLDAEAREKLRLFGIAPPALATGDPTAALKDPVPCPYCHSHHTHIENAFGPTLCRQIYYCDNCSQSFERFKTL